MVRYIHVHDDRPHLEFKGSLYFQVVTSKVIEEVYRLLIHCLVPCLFIRAVVPEHHVIFSSFFLKTLSVFPLIFSLVKEPVRKQTSFRILLTHFNVENQEVFSFIAQSHFFLKISLAFSRSPQQAVRLLWPTFPTKQTIEKPTQNIFSLFAFCNRSSKLQACLNILWKYKYLCLQ